MSFIACYLSLYFTLYKRRANFQPCEQEYLLWIPSEARHSSQSDRPSLTSKFSCTTELRESFHTRTRSLSLQIILLVTMITFTLAPLWLHNQVFTALTVFLKVVRTVYAKISQRKSFVYSNRTSKKSQYLNTENIFLKFIVSDS